MKPRQRFVTIATAHDQTEVIRLRMLLDRTQVPYRVKGETLHAVYGFLGGAAFGPMEFLVPAEMEEEAVAALGELFELHSDDLPSNCPACSHPVHPGDLDCKDCGLSLA